VDSTGCSWMNGFYENHDEPWVSKEPENLLANLTKKNKKTKFLRYLHKSKYRMTRINRNQTENFIEIL
jgi:hypothetical protein